MTGRSVKGNVVLKRGITTMALAGALFVLTPNAAQAEQVRETGVAGVFHKIAKKLNNAADRMSDSVDRNGKPLAKKPARKVKPGNGTGHGNPGPVGGPVAVPELDASSAGAALTLVLGGSLLLIDRRRRRA